jgi:transcriptional regulator with XRE-family HTH domain
MTKAEFAQRLGLSSAALSRILHARGVLNVERSLKVASLYDIDAAVVLRAAGHHKIVDLLEEVYTPQRIRSIKDVARGATSVHPEFRKPLALGANPV